MRLPFLLLAGLSLLPARLASAHDFWVEPETFTATTGARVFVRLKVGSKKDVQTIDRRPNRILRLEGVSSETRPVVGPAGADPVGHIDTAGLEGDAILVYESNHAYIELEAAKFESYLEHEGLESIMLERKKAGETKTIGRESYARSCKALMTVGDADQGWRREVGLPLEFVPLADPRRPRSELRFVLRLRGQPLAGARVDLMSLEDLEASTAATTDKQGILRFANPGPGQYMVASTHMARARPPVKGDWESLWSTFAFEISSPR